MKSTQSRISGTILAEALLAKSEGQAKRFVQSQESNAEEGQSLQHVIAAG